MAAKFARMRAMMAEEDSERATSEGDDLKCTMDNTLDNIDEE